MRLINCPWEALHADMYDYVTELTRLSKVGFYKIEVFTK